MLWVRLTCSDAAAGGAAQQLVPTRAVALCLPPVSAQADLWSIGTILFELLVGKPPYNGANHIQLLRNIEAAEARLPDHVAARLSPACKGLLGRLLQRNPVERITFEEFFTHPFLTGEGTAQGEEGHCLLDVLTAATCACTALGRYGFCWGLTTTCLHVDCY